jgi:NitT/TauT family transport system permease protein
MRIWIRLLSVVSVLAGWQGVSLLVGSTLFPGPIVIVGAVAENVKEHLLLENIWATMRRVYVGFAISLLAGMAFGVAMGLKRMVNDFLDLWVMLVLAVPSLCWSILALMWFGLTEFAAIFVIAIISFPVMAINSLEGVKNTPKELVQMAHVFKARRGKVIKDIILPPLFPYVLAGSRYGLGLAWKIAIIAEMLGMSTGVGYMIRFNYHLFRMDQVLAWTLVFSLIILTVDNLILKTVERKLMAWRSAIAT